MPGPFPGMDPYLEAPAGWPEVHNALAYAIYGLLNRKLPRPFYARTERRMVSASAFDLRIASTRVPDGSVMTREWPPSPAAGAVVLPGVRDAVSPAMLVEASPEVEEEAEVELDSVVVRDGPGEDGLVTAIEILSYANKLGGEDRRSYTTKQREYAGRRVSLVEIDLLRRGRRSAAALPAQVLAERAGRRADYLIFIRRELYDGESGRRERFAQPFGLPDPLPVAPVPLRAGVPDIGLDLQYCLDEVYSRGPFTSVTDYDAPADPPIPRDFADWAAERVAAWREGREPTVPPPNGTPPSGDGEPGAVA